MITTLLTCVLLTGAAPAPRQTPGTDLEPVPRPGDEKSFVLELIDDRGQPLADVGVQLGMSIRRRNGGTWRGLPRAPRRTDDAGRLVIPEEPEWAGEAFLTVRIAEIEVTGERMPKIEVPWDGKRGARTWVVPRPGWIAGRVTRRTSDDRVFVWFERHNRATPELLEVDEQGRFRLGPLAAGLHAFDFSLGLARETVEFDVPPGATTDEILVDLNRGGWVVGQALGFDGQPLLGGEVSLSTTGWHRIVAPSVDVEAPHARFTIGPLPPGLHPVQLFEERGSFALVRTWIEVPEVGDVVLELRAAGPPVTVTGSVNRGAAPLANAYVDLGVPGTHQSVRGHCDESGRFMLRVPFPGIYDLRAGAFLVEDLRLDGEAEHFDVRVPANALEIEKPAFGDASKTWRFDVHPLDPRLRPGTHGRLSTEKTDRPRIEGLAPGEYRVSARQGPQAVAWSRVTVPELGTVALAFEDVPAASLEVVARMADGKPAPHVGLGVQDEHGLQISYPDKVPPGPLRVWARSGQEVGLAQVDLQPGEHREVEVILAPAATLELSGTRNGAPVVPFAFLLHERGHLFDSRIFQPVTGPGTLTIGSLPEGRYTIVARVPGAPWRSEAITVRAGETATRSLHFD